MEIFPGFGVPELLAVAAGGAVGYLLQLIPAALPLDTGPKLFIRFFSFGIPLSAAYMLVHQDASGSSLYSQLKALRGWSSRPQVYYYRRGVK